MKSIILSFVCFIHLAILSCVLFDHACQKVVLLLYAYVASIEGGVPENCHSWPKGDKAMCMWECFSGLFFFRVASFSLE